MSRLPHHQLVLLHVREWVRDGVECVAAGSGHEMEILGSSLALGLSLARA